ncbi:MAG: PQQ-binding-like beta-propeller repeat protein [Sphingobacteriaceae bacterium]|nr:PQQ-binding-like beta-propeller repeat protein [Cytophagaceae bacterium]
MKPVLLLVIGAIVSLTTATFKEATPFFAEKNVIPADSTQPFSDPVLPGKGLHEHPFLYAGEWDTRNAMQNLQTLFVVRGGKVVWSYGFPIKDSAGVIQELGDASMLKNGNIIFSGKTFAALITPAKKIIWKYTAPKNSEIHTAQPIGPNQVLLMQNGNLTTPRLLIFNTKTNTIEKELAIATTNPDHPHGQFRHIRMTKAGTFLIPNMSGKVVEIDADGKEIWQVTAPGAWAAVRLKNGNTLISGDSKGFAREVNPKGETVWEFTQKDVPTIKIFNIQEATRLDNGNTVIANWCAGLKNDADWPKTVQILEVTPAKKVVWALRSWDAPNDLGPASSIHLLDQKGLMENFDLQR